MDEHVEIRVKAYTASAKTEWDQFVAESRNATFLSQRDYMDYHSDRFDDVSVMVYSVRAGRQTLVSLLPACKGDDCTVTSHGGLTYGGFVLPVKGLDGARMLDVFQEVAQYYRRMGFKRLRYKPIPHIYHRYPAEEDLYALFRCGARIVESNISSTILLSDRLPFNENSRRNVAKAIKSGIEISESDDFAGYWNVLVELLGERYSTRPVHTLEEISELKRKFPDRIRLFTARNANGDILAGSVLYFTRTCVHAQYIAASPEGKANGALSMLFADVLDRHCGDARYFDFGTSNEQHGLKLNHGLLMQKNGMGGRATVYNIYEVEL